MCIEQAELKYYIYNAVNKIAVARHTIYKYNDKYNICVLCGPEIYEMYCKCYVDVVVL